MTPPAVRTRDEIAALLDGWDLLPSGLVPISQWRPGPDDAPAAALSVLGAAGRLTR
ncbi:SAM-dependent methyltransferase [Actinoplanes sp. NBRC 101535]|uniref:SAM-dependent methyltransferase n=1 Tax=Actinoplanes sp. NBRC 101535 TaxID=3032196 RepID=UPI0024A3DFCA|nr:SAM-dependent methyltransferase [Actinoplanes sp. NBRC 101535]GLY07928.1 hypothetical protein Acsp01_83070 [Actinoplanes sp. NBRC 101535]